MNVKVGANLIFVNNIEKSKTWYEKVFGMKQVAYRPPEFLEMKLGKNIFYIETHSDRRAEGFKKAYIGGRFSIVFRVKDVSKFINEAKKKGVKVIVEPVQQFWGGWTACIADPDGNEFIIDDGN